MDRRQFLKGCSLLPFLASPNTIPHWLFQQKPTEVFVFLHGLMFMEVTNAGLKVTIPTVDKHEYDYASLKTGEIIDKTKLKQVPQKHQFDFTNCLQGGTKNVFPKEIPQFPVSITGPITSTDYWFQILLPFPDQIIPIRIVNCPSIDLAGEVGRAIKGNSIVFASVACLKYRNNADQSQKHHFFAQPSSCPADDQRHSNAAFKTAANLFNDRSKFDLAINKSDSSCCLEPQNQDSPLTIEDSYQLCEVRDQPIKCQNNVVGIIGFTGGPLCSTIAVTPALNKGK